MTALTGSRLPGRRSPRIMRRSRICICATLFADDPGRAERFSAEGAGLFLDYSKNRITD